MVLPTVGCQGPDSETSVRVGHCTSEDRRCLACKEDIELELEFQERRRAIRTRMNANHDPFILKLPPEIGSHIFLLSMGLRDNYFPLRGGGLPTPFLLGAVCRGWRQLARSTPRLWTTLGFDFFDPTDPTSKTMEALPQLVSDWLERSGGLPLTLNISFEGDCETPSEESLSIINALNNHSGRWYKVWFILPRDYLERLCGSSPPRLLCDLTISDAPDSDEYDIPLTFKMNERPSPMQLDFGGFLLDAVDISWDRLVDLDLRRTTINGVLKVLRNAPLLKKCSLSEIALPIDQLFNFKPITRLQYLQTLEVSWFEEIEVFYNFIDSLELPSLELWSISVRESWVLDNMISFLERSRCSLKSLYIWQDNAAAVGDFGRLFQSVPRLRHLEVLSPTHDSSSIMDYILERLASSQYPTLQTDATAGFLSDLQSLKLHGPEVNAWVCIPLIYRWPHRKLLDLDIATRHVGAVTIDREVSSELVQLVDQGIKLQISCGFHDYISMLRESGT